MRKLSVLLLGGGLLLSGPALAQFNPALYAGLYSHQHCCCHCGPRDTTTTTERTNRVAGLGGATLLLGADGRARGGGFVEVGAAVAPRLTITGHLMMTANRASDTNFGTGATAPAYGLHALTGRARYQLRNGRRWRVEALAGLGLGAVQVVDRDQQIDSYDSYGRRAGRHSATVAFRVQPLAEVGLSTSWKLKRDFWLTSQATYAQPALSGGLGPAGEFAYCNLSVGVTVPWGYPVTQR